MQVTPTSNAVGAEVSGIDLRALSEADLEGVVSALGDHGVLFFRDQDLSPDDHIAFARRVGPININRFFSAVDGHPEIAEVLKEPDQVRNIGGGWHTDHSYDTEPALGSVLYAREIPPTGGDTLFAGMGAAYDALSDSFKTTLRTLQAVHSSRHVFGDGARGREGVEDRIGNTELATQDAVHPVVIAHPRTGRPLLYVNPGFTTGIEGWNAKESKALLDFLFQHASRPEFQTRFRWTPGAVAMWDNRSTWHFALNDYQGHRRYLHRITIDGGPLVAA